MRRIIIDAGHGGKDSGAIGEFGKTVIQEADAVLIVAQKVEHMLTKQGYKVYMTRNSDVFIALGKRPRVASADLFVSIHINSIEDSTAHGFETWTRKPSGKGWLLAHKVQEKLINTLRHYHDVKGTKNYSVVDRGVKCENFAVLKTATPSCLVECGFIKHKVEGKLLNNDNYLWQLAFGIVSGINAYLRR